jgi:CRISPR-associated protein Csm4
MKSVSRILKLNLKLKNNTQDGLMDNYKDYTIKTILKSPIITPLQADTIFGHICWAIRFLKWDNEDKLGCFLAQYDNRDFPPLLLSNGFPLGYLPKPILPPVTQEELEKFLIIENRIENSFKIKTIKKAEFIQKRDFVFLQEEKITPFKLFEIMFKNFKNIMDQKNKLQDVVIQHNTINRIEGKVSMGLYAHEETFYDFYDRDNCSFEIYLKTYFFSHKEIERLFAFIREQGFGKDKSTGKGFFDFEIIEGIDLPEAKEANAFMTLSSYIPSENDPTNGNYNLLLKYGKLGGLYSKGISEVNGNPFKVPLIMFSAGSVFYDDGYEKGKIYGSLLKEVHHNKNIRHYAYAFPIGINL